MTFDYLGLIVDLVTVFIILGLNIVLWKTSSEVAWVEALLIVMFVRWYRHDREWE
jgi:hypothetical protein